MKYSFHQIVAMIISGLIIFRISYSPLSFIYRLAIVALIVVATRCLILD